MTDIFEQNFTSANASRSYPLKETAQKSLDFPNDLLLDCSLVLIADIENYHVRPFISTLYAKKESDIHISFSAKLESRTDTSSQILRLASFYIEDYIPNKTYYLADDLEDRILSCTVAFGYIEEDFYLRSATADETELTASCYHVIPESIMKAIYSGKQKLTGDIELKTRGDGVISIGSRKINGAMEEAIILGLKRDKNTLAKYVPDFAKQVETYIDQKPILSINKKQGSSLRFTTRTINKPSDNTADLITISEGDSIIVLNPTIGFGEICQLRKNMQTVLEKTLDYYDPGPI